jgi:outer membrane protein
MQLKTLGCFFLCLAALAGQGQTEGSTNRQEKISLQECIRLALLHNRQLQVQRYNPDIARLTLGASYAAYDPMFTSGYRHTHEVASGTIDPVTLERVLPYNAQSQLADVGISGALPFGLSYDLSTTYDNTYGSRAGGPFDNYSASAGAKVTQHLLKDFWTDQTRTSIQVNKHNLKITELGVDYLVMDIITQVEKAYYELIYARDYVKVQEKLLEVRQRFYDETRQKILIGKLAALDEKLAQSQVAKVQADLIGAHNRVALAENQLKGLLGDDFVSSVDRRMAPADALVVVPETFDLGASWRQGLAQRRDLAQLRQDVQKADLDVKYRYNQLWPALDMVAGYGLRGSDQIATGQADNGGLVIHDPSAAGAYGDIRSRNNPNDLLGVIFSVPLSRKGDRENYRASKTRKAQAEVVVKQREEVVLREIDDAVKTARTSLQRITATRQATEYAQAALEAEEKKLAAGVSTAYVVLQLQGELAAAAVDELRAKADYNIAVAQLHFVEGSVLERNQIQIELK